MHHYVLYIYYFVMLLNLGMDLSLIKYPINSSALIFLIFISLRVLT